MSKKIWNFIIGLLLIVCGAVLLVNPEQSFSKLVFFIGIVLLITGVIKIIYAFVNRDYVYLPGNVFMSGFLNTLFGFVLIFNPDTTTKIISIFIGLWLLSTSLSSLVLLLNIRSKDYFSQTMLVTSILKLIIGLLVLVTPIISVLFTGIFLGVFLIVIGICTIFNYKNEEKIYKVKVKK